MAAHDIGSHETDVFQVKQVRFGISIRQRLPGRQQGRIGCSIPFFDRQRFAAQDGLTDEQVARLEEVHIGRHKISGGEIDHIARNQFTDVDFCAGLRCRAVPRAPDRCRRLYH